MTVEINRVKVKVFSELTWPICVGSGLPIECRNFVPRDRMGQSNAQDLPKTSKMASSFEKILLVDNIWMKFNYLLARYDCEMEI